MGVSMIDKIMSLWGAPKYFAPLYGLAMAAVLGAAFVFQYGFGYQPCILCYYQRAPYAAAIALAVAAFAVLCAVDNKKWNAGKMRPANWFQIYRAIIWVIVAAMMMGCGIAIYHVGVEQHLWAGPTVCATMGQSGDLDALMLEIMNAKPVRCDEVAWTLFGISMAGYNVILSVILAWVGAVHLRLARGYGW